MDQPQSHHSPSAAVRLAIFSHGMESGPMGRKIQRLIAVARQLGIDTASVDYRQCANADERVALLRDTIANCHVPSREIALVGSSMGGYVATVAANDTTVAGLFLMAPALWMPAVIFPVQDYNPLTDKVEITHGLRDDIVPWANSLRLATTHPGTTLHLVDDDHRLSASLEFLATQFDRFLHELTKFP